MLKQLTLIILLKLSQIYVLVTQQKNQKCRMLLLKFDSNCKTLIIIYGQAF